MSNRRIKFLCAIGFFVCILLIIMALIFLKKYTGSPEYNDNNNNNTRNVKMDMESTPTPAAVAVKTEEPEPQVITSSTRFVLQTHYVDAKSHEELEEKDETVPSDIIAMNREELEEYLRKYMEELPLNEYLNGLLAYELIDFSGDQVILRKTYASDWNEHEFYLCDVEGEVVVYYSDKDTVFEYTGIKTANLGQEEQIRLKIGYYVSDEEELYALLESYSS